MVNNLKLKKMKKKILLSSSLFGIVFALSSFKASTRQGDPDGFIIINAHQSFTVNGQYYPPTPSTKTVEICPGNGAPCSVTITTNGNSTSYNGSKTLGGPDVVIKS